MSVDYPRAWQIARSVPISKHHPECSYRTEEGGLLCDCDILNKHQEVTDNTLQTIDGFEYKDGNNE